MPTDFLHNPYNNGVPPPRKLACRISEEDFIYLNSRFPSCVGLHDKLLSMLVKSLTNELRRIDDEHLLNFPGCTPDPAWCADDPAYSILADTLVSLIRDGRYRRDSGLGWVRTAAGRDVDRGTTEIRPTLPTAPSLSPDLSSGTSQSRDETRSDKDKNSEAGHDSGRDEVARPLTSLERAKLQLKQILGET